MFKCIAQANARQGARYFSNRRLLKITNNEAPISAATAIQMFANPTAANMRKTALIANAAAIFSLMADSVRFPRLTTFGRGSRVSPKKMMSECCAGMSLPNLASEIETSDPKAPPRR